LSHRQIFQHLSGRPLSPRSRASGQGISPPRKGPLLTTYAAAIVQERAIAHELEAAEDEKAKDRLRLAHGRVAGSLTKLARALRLGPMAREPGRHRRAPSTIEPSGALPWEYRPGDKPN
jgi:hypothetical protein